MMENMTETENTRKLTPFEEAKVEEEATTEDTMNKDLAASALDPLLSWKDDNRTYTNTTMMKRLY